MKEKRRTIMYECFHGHTKNVKMSQIEESTETEIKEENDVRQKMKRKRKNI